MVNTVLSTGIRTHPSLVMSLPLTTTRPSGYFKDGQFFLKWLNDGQELF